MANIIYDQKQKKAVNLDNVDSITCSESGADFQIIFYKVAPWDSRTADTSIAKWTYKDESERDTVFNLIIQKYGSWLNTQGPAVF